jgi:hypothetical protein
MAKNTKRRLNDDRPRRIAPRLASGDSRVPFGHGLPEAIKQGLRELAQLENSSMSWVLEQIITDWLAHSPVLVEAPEYKRPSAGSQSQPPETGRVLSLRRRLKVG